MSESKGLNVLCESKMIYISEGVDSIHLFIHPFINEDIYNSSLITWE